MKMQKRKFRIGELAQKLNVERFVVRFWEKEFGIKTKRSQGSQRFYDENDLKKFEHIKQLLYEEGFTIVGAKKKIKDKAPHKSEKVEKTDKSEKSETVLPSHKTTMEDSATGTTAVSTKNAPSPADSEKIEQLSQQIVDLKNKLRKLRETL